MSDGIARTGVGDPVRTVQAVIASTTVVAITAIDLVAPWMEDEDGDVRGASDDRMQEEEGRSRGGMAEEQKRRDWMLS